MNVTEIQKRVDALVAPMLAKGLRKPEAEAEFRSQGEPRLWLRYLKADATYDHDRHFESIDGDDLEAKFAAALEWIEALPAIEERKLREFMAAVGKAADMGRELGIEADFVNPLTVLMKTLSENALTNQRHPAE